MKNNLDLLEVVETGTSACGVAGHQFIHRDILPAFLSALRAAGYIVEFGWRPIRTAPRDGTNVLLFCDDRADYGCSEPIVGCWNKDCEFWETGYSEECESERYGPHWWMPLPSPPPKHVLKSAEEARFAVKSGAPWKAK